MKPETIELTKSERQWSDFGFITETIQRGRIRPAKFIHILEIPKYIYDELVLHAIIKPENYFIHESAFFEYRHERVIISFVSRGLCDDLQFAIDRYLIVEFCGKYPIERKYSSKMNHDKPEKNVELVVLQRTKTKKSHI
jgi:hypothetical protein